MDTDELRLVWTDMLGTAMTIDRRLTGEQTLNINRPSWCREQIMVITSAQPFSLIFHNHTFLYILRMVCRRRLPIDPLD